MEEKETTEEKKMELSEEVLESKPQLLWRWQEFFIVASKNQVKKFSLLLEGKKINSEGEIEIIKNFNYEKEAEKVKVWVQNNTKTIQPATGEDWEHFVSAIFSRISSYKVIGLDTPEES